ncbi:MAG: FtsW/RodA/SpoVE family cell cycle protein [Anaerolineales bacterium]|jgi:cell division protein FtsW|nr:FtsW/RodA/SpoVE family cell cycle protein [Anaerolineales bacterium]
MFRTLGQRIGLKTNPGGVSPASSSRPIHLRVDLPLLLTVALLLVFGILMVYSSSYDISFRKDGDPFEIVRKQSLFMLLGIVGAAVLAFIDYHFYQRVAVPIIAATILALLAVQFTGSADNPYQRTLLPNSVQPSELAKLAIIIYLAVWLFSKRDMLHDVQFGLAPLAIILGVVSGLIAIQPDYSAMITILALGGLLFFLAGADIRQLVILAVLTGMAGMLVYIASNTVSLRVGGFIAGIRDPLKAPDQVQRSIESFINGGWFGVGIGKGQTKLTALQFPHTDSVFAVVGEETGMLGAIFLLVLFSVLLWRGFKIANQAPDQLGSLLAAGLTLWIAFEAFVNMASIVSLIPFAGNALPFISVGGSSLVMTLAAIGILLNISRLSVQNQDANGRTFSEVVDLRGRNRRRRVSRSDRSAGAHPEIS